MLGGELAELHRLRAGARPRARKPSGGPGPDRDSDPDFGRGDSAYDGFNGDITRYPGKDSTLGAISAAPLYALPLESSALGTKGGPRTNRHGAVLNVDGEVIVGLYAAGNVMAGPTGMVTSYKPDKAPPCPTD